MKCSSCIYYLTDEDKEGNLVEFHHDEKVESGFCILHDLFYIREAGDKACKKFVSDRG